MTVPLTYDPAPLSSLSHLLRFCFCPSEAEAVVLLDKPEPDPPLQIVPQGGQQIAQTVHELETQLHELETHLFIRPKPLFISPRYSSIGEFQAHVLESQALDGT